MSYTNIHHSLCCLQGESRESTESTGLIVLQWLFGKGWFSWQSFTILEFGCRFWAPAWLGKGRGAARLYRAQIKCTCFSRVRWDLNKSWLLALVFSDPSQSTVNFKVKWLVSSSFSRTCIAPYSVKHIFIPTQELQPNIVSGVLWGSSLLKT